MVNPFAVGSWDTSINLILMAVIFFIGAILRKQIPDAGGPDFSLIGSCALGEIVFIAMMFILSSQKWAFLGALIGIAIGGFLGGSILGSGDSGEE